MDEYFPKLRQLSVERLELLAEKYRKTISQMELRIRDAIIVAHTAVIEYTQQELDKKRAELVAIEQILDKKRKSEKV